MDILQLTTTQTVLLYIVSIAISLFFVLGAVLLIVGLALVSKVKKLVAKAESAIDSVEEAAGTLKDIGSHATGPLAAFKVIKAIVDVVNHRK